MSLKDIQPGQQISAADLRQVGELMEQFAPSMASGSPAMISRTPSGSVVAPDGADLFIAKITNIRTQTAPEPTHYGFVEQIQAAHGTNVGEWVDSPSGRRSAGNSNYALAPQGFYYAVGDYVLMRRHRYDVNLYEILETELGWQLAKISAQYGGDPPKYDAVKIGLRWNSGASKFEFYTVSPTVTYTPVFRMSPLKDWTENAGSNPPVVPRIPVGMPVLVRLAITTEYDTSTPPVKLHDPAYVCTPWGGFKDTIIEHLYRTCSECDGSGNIITHNAIRLLFEGGIDRACFLMDPATAERHIQAINPEIV